MKKTGYPYDQFQDWLQTKHELSAITTVSYASQCRRIARSAGVDDVCNLKLLSAIERDDVEDFFCTQKNSKNMTPFRRSWRMFRDFLIEREQLVLCSIELDDGWEEVPSEVAQAIRELDRQDFAFRLIPSMKWDKNEVISGITSDFAINVEVNGDPKVVVLPTEPLLTITMWAYPDSVPTAENWIIPREPKSRHPMSLTMLRKVAGII